MFIARRWHDHKGYVRVEDRLTLTHGPLQAIPICGDRFLEIGFLSRSAAGVQRVHGPSIDVDADYVKTTARDTGGHARAQFAKSCD